MNSTDSIRLSQPLKVGCLKRIWQPMIGSCHAYLVLRKDYQDQLRMVKRELNIHSVRFHGILTDDVGVAKKDDVKGFRLSPNQLDKIYDFVLSIGMKPFVELSFMPKIFASGEKTIFEWRGNITPPKDYKIWHEFIIALVQHLVRRYGKSEVESWNFEVWNEPDLDFFWSGTQTEYFHLYKETVLAIKKVSPRIAVGGPSTSRAKWLREFMQFCKTENVPMDFLSTHIYPNDEPLILVDEQKKATFKDKWFLNAIFDESYQAKQEFYPDKPLYFTEWNSSADLRDSQHDDAFMGPFLCRTLTQSMQKLDAASFWAFSDIFEEQGSPDGEFHGGFGLLSFSGLKKISYKIFQIFHELGEEIVDQGNHHLITYNAKQELQVLVWNYIHPGETKKTIPYHFDLQQFQIPNAWQRIILGPHDNNVYPVWQSLGSPSSLLPGEYEMLIDYNRIRFTAHHIDKTISGILGADEVHYWKILKS